MLNTLLRMVILLGSAGLTACATQPVSTTQSQMNAQPEWVNPGYQPDSGIIRSSALHFLGKDKTRQLLLDSALVELSKAQFGSSISLNSQIQKTTQSYNDQAHTQITQTDYAEVTQANGSALVKAKVKAEWYNPAIERLYLWVVPAP